MEFFCKKSFLSLELTLLFFTAMQFILLLDIYFYIYDKPYDIQLIKSFAMFFLHFISYIYIFLILLSFLFHRRRIHFSIIMCHVYWRCHLTSVKAMEDCLSISVSICTIFIIFLLILYCYLINLQLIGFIAVVLCGCAVLSSHAVSLTKYIFLLLEQKEKRFIYYYLVPMAPVPPQKRKKEF